MISRPSSCGRNAFSLVEVALALGIIAFAFVAILGLMSVGIDAARDSGDATKIGFIMQDVAARVRTEVAGVDLAADPTKMDLTWNAAYNSQLSYTILGNTVLPKDVVTGQPPPAASAYYTVDGLLVKQADATAPTANFYKASVYVQPLPAYPFPTPAPSSTGSDYPFLAVTVKVGWPANNQVNGSVPGAANVSKSIFTFYLLKP